MQELDVFADHQTSQTSFEGMHPEVEFIRPELVVDITAPFPIYHTLEEVRPKESRFSYEDLRLSNITGVQFINPWSIQDEGLFENTIPFFVTVSNSNGSRACLMRYNVTHYANGTYVNRPILEQVTITSSPQLEIVSPTLIIDDFGTIWGTEGGLIYVTDLSRGTTGTSGQYSSDTFHPVLLAPINFSRIIIHEESANTMRHRVGFDPISGRKFKVFRTAITVDDYATSNMQLHSGSTSSA
jgi:hypothetical protein